MNKEELTAYLLANKTSDDKLTLQTHIKIIDEEITTTEQIDEHFNG